MNRRQFLAAVGVASLAGCQTSASEETPTETATPTATPTPTPTETATPDPEPDIETVALLTDWKEYGDVLENQRSSIAPDDPALVGARFALVCAPDREVRWRREIQIHNSYGDVVATNSDSSNDFSNDCADSSTVAWEHVGQLYYDNDPGAEWPEGKYEAEVRIEDYHGEMGVYDSAAFTVEAE